MLASSAAIGAPPSVLQRGYDLFVTGANRQETILNTSNVNPTKFGMLFTLPVDDNVYAQPLYVPGVTLSDGSIHNVVYVATMSDTLYAFDADTGAQLWSINLALSVGATPVPEARFAFSGNRNITGNLGILSTPVIDPSSNLMYLVAATLELDSMVYRLHMVDIRSGAEPVGSGVPISGSYGGVVFDGRYVTQRVSLTLCANQVVFGFGALELEYSSTYSGWVMAYTKGTLTQSGAFATVTTGSQGGGVWQSGRPPVCDPYGYVYVFVGNAYSSNGYDGVNNFSESVLKLEASAGLSLVDWFTPSIWRTLDKHDLDLTSSGPMLIPGTGHLVGGGKTGVLYVLNDSNLGKYTSNDSQIIQKKTASLGELRGGPVLWQRPTTAGGDVVYNWGVNDALKSWPYNGRVLTASASALGGPTSQRFPGGILALSANGFKAGSGIVWATVSTSGNSEDNPPTTGALYAFDADNVSSELWDSKMNASRDGFGNFAKFVPPLVVNGKVYVATFSNQVAVYGLLP